MRTRIQNNDNNPSDDKGIVIENLERGISDLLIPSGPLKTRGFGFVALQELSFTGSMVRTFETINYFTKAAATYASWEQHSS